MTLSVLIEFCDCALRIDNFKEHVVNSKVYLLLNNSATILSNEIYQDKTIKLHLLSVNRQLFNILGHRDMYLIAFIMM